MPLFLAVLSAVLLLVAPAASQAQTQSEAQTIQAPLVVAPGQARPDTIAVAELFSSQACVFCPQADEIFGKLLEQDRVIGLACHVDYFKVKEGSLAQPFCTDRQTAYMERLNAGPNYTPQLILDGRYDIVGHKEDKIITALAYALDKSPVRRLGIAANDQTGGYSLFPLNVEEDNLPAEPWQIWIALYDAPHDVTIAGGRNKGKAVRYRHIISAVQDGGSWDGRAPLPLAVTLTAGQAGFVVIASQGPQGPIAAAGEFKKAMIQPPKQSPDAVIQPETIPETPPEN